MKAGFTSVISKLSIRNLFKKYLTTLAQKEIRAKKIDTRIKKKIQTS